MAERNEGRTSALWTALAAGSLGLLGPILAEGGRLAWLAPLLCLPLALGIGRLWRRLGSLPSAFGRPVLLLYYIWALVLLAESGFGYVDRLVTTARSGSPWCFLAAAAALCLWLCRGGGAIPARSGRIFFLGVAAVLALTVALSLPGLRWENLWPPEKGEGSGLPAAALLSLSLAGYGVYGLCLPEDGQKKAGGPWAVFICIIVAGMLLALIGSFGAPLSAGRPEPVLLLLEGVQVPGIFRHGEAALEGGLALADLTLMAVLTYGCRELWSGLVPGKSPWWGLLPPAGAILTAGLIPPSWQAVLTGRIIPIGNLLLGVLAPGVALFTRKIKEP